MTLSGTYTRAQRHTNERPFGLPFSLLASALALERKWAHRRDACPPSEAARIRAVYDTRVHLDLPRLRQDQAGFILETLWHEPRGLALEARAVLLT